MSELLSLPPPDTSYRVVYEVEDSATVALRQELGGLRLWLCIARHRCWQQVTQSWRMLWIGSDKRLH